MELTFRPLRERSMTIGSRADLRPAWTRPGALRAAQRSVPLRHEVTLAPVAGSTISIFAAMVPCATPPRIVPRIVCVTVPSLSPYVSRAIPVARKAPRRESRAGENTFSPRLIVGGAKAANEAAPDHVAPLPSSHGARTWTSSCVSDRPLPATRRAIGASCAVWPPLDLHGGRGGGCCGAEGQDRGRADE